MTDQPQNPHDPYAPQDPYAPYAPGPAPETYEPRDPDTQVWQGPTHQEHGYGAAQPPPAAWSSADTARMPRQAPAPLSPEPAPWAGPGSGAPQRGTGVPAAPYAHSGTAGAAPGRTAPPFTGTGPGTGSRPEGPGVPEDRADAAPLTPAQRARAEGLSPIIAPGLQPALLTAALAALIALTAPLHQAALAVPVVLLQAVTAAGWFRLNGMWPARQGIALAFAGGLAADIALLATDRGDAAKVGIGTLGVWFLLVLILQLRNRGSSDERLSALTAGLASSALAIVAAGQLAAAPYSPAAVVAGAAAVAVAAVVRALSLRLPAALSYAAALAGAVAAGFAAGLFADAGGPGALLGAVAGVCALIGLRVASYDYPSRFVHMTAGVALPLAVAAPAVYILSRTIG